jgi:hypothetical protein
MIPRMKNGQLVPNEELDPEPMTEEQLKAAMTPEGWAEYQAAVERDRKALAASD